MFDVHEDRGDSRVVLAWSFHVAAPRDGSASAVIDRFAQRAVPVFSHVREGRVIRLRFGKQHENVADRTERGAERLKAAFFLELRARVLQHDLQHQLYLFASVHPIAPALLLLRLGRRGGFLLFEDGSGGQRRGRFRPGAASGRPGSSGPPREFPRSGRG